MARAYGAVLVVLAVGFVAFVLLISFMAFDNPSKGEAFLEHFAGPALGLLAAYALKAGHGYVTKIGQNNKS